jgi:hypothetical protein
MIDLIVWEKGRNGVTMTKRGLAQQGIFRGFQHLAYFSKLNWRMNSNYLEQFLLEFKTRGHIKTVEKCMAAWMHQTNI